MEEHNGQQQVEVEATEHGHRTWRQRHGASLIAGVVGVVFLALIGFQMGC